MNTSMIKSAAVALALLAPTAAFAAPYAGPEPRGVTMVTPHETARKSAVSAYAREQRVERPEPAAILPFAPRSDAWMHWDANENEG